jgi:hypothetical protein
LPQKQFVFAFPAIRIPKEQFLYWRFWAQIGVEKRDVVVGNRDDLELPTLTYSGPIAQGGQGPPLMLAE